MATEVTADIIQDRGRGPEIKGTRITVYDVLDYYAHGDHPDLIAAVLRIGNAQVRAAIEYIERHKQEVFAEYQKMLAREAQGNPPDVRAKVEESHRRFQELVHRLQSSSKGGAYGQAAR
jgi:uncharacterized protein (DUF433 family)